MTTWFKRISIGRLEDYAYSLRIGAGYPTEATTVILRYLVQKPSSVFRPANIGPKLINELRDLFPGDTRIEDRRAMYLCAIDAITQIPIIHWSMSDSYITAICKRMSVPQNAKYGFTGLLCSNCEEYGDTGGRFQYRGAEKYGHVKLWCKYATCISKPKREKKY